MFLFANKPDFNNNVVWRLKIDQLWHIDVSRAVIAQLFFKQTNINTSFAKSRKIKFLWISIYLSARTRIKKNYFWRKKAFNLNMNKKRTRSSCRPLNNKTNPKEKTNKKKTKKILKTWNFILFALSYDTYQQNHLPKKSNAHICNLAEQRKRISPWNFISNLRSTCNL